MRSKFSILASAVALALLSAAALTAQDASFTLRPTEYAAGARGYNNPTAAYDGNLTTASSASVTQANKGATVAMETWYGFPAAPGGVTQMQLNINSSATTGRGGDAILYYSLNGGSSFTAVYMVLDSSRSQRTDVIPLSDSQDTTKIRVEGYILADTDGTFVSTASQSIFEIWVSGTD